MPDDKVLEQLDKIITEKIDSALKPIFEKLDALTPKPDDDGEQEEKLDALTLAKQTIRAKLDGFIPAEKLDKMTMLEMSQTLAKLQSTLSNPEQSGILNVIPEGGNKKLDAIFSGKTVDEIIWE
jgi:hypothetical protein